MVSWAHRYCSVIPGVPAVLLLLALGSTHAFAQGSRTIVRGNPDGSHEVLLLTAPDYTNLRTPDFTARDLPLMKRKLVLSEEQASVINRLIEQYIESFRKLTKELAAATAPEAEYIPSHKPPESPEPPQSKSPESKSPESESPASETENAAASGAGGAKPSDGPMQMNLDGIDLPPSVNVSIGVSISTSRSDDPNVPAPPPQVKVGVTLDDPEGDEIPQQTLDKIRERANQVVASMVEHLMAEEAARQAGEAPKKPVIEATDDFATIKADHDGLMLKVDEFLKAKAQLRAQFVLDAQASLADVQAARWPSLERALYRERSLPKGQLPGESVDLVKIIEGLGLSEEQLESIASEIESFEMALDAALRQRDALLATATQKIDEAIANRKPDLALSLTDRVTSHRLAVRNVNQTHIDLFASVLGNPPTPAPAPGTGPGMGTARDPAPGIGESFRLAALSACYPNVYTQTRGRKMFAVVMKMGDLDEQVRRDIAGLEAAYDAELAVINEQLRTTTDRERARGARQGIEHLKDSMEGTQSSAIDREDPVRALIIRRAELDDRYLNLVSPLVGAERAAALPKPRKNRDPIRIESGAEE